MTFIDRQYLAGVPARGRIEFVLNHVNLGYHPETKDDFYVHINDRYSGVYISGMPGSGKSSLEENMIIQDAEDKAVIVLDPHMDMVTRLIGKLSGMRLPDAYLLDMTDEDYPFGINIFNTGNLTNDMAITQAVERILHVFEVVWPDVLSQQYLPRYLRMAIQAFLASPGVTLPDMYNFLLDDAYRRQLLQNVTDPAIKQFWQVQYDNLPPATRLSRVQPLLGRLEQLFAGRKLVRNIVGQKQNSIDFRKSILNKEIVFVKLPLKLIPEDARLIGTILVSQIHAALFSFVDLPENKRPGVSLYIDEFQHFATPDIAELITEGRKFSMRIHLAHQYRGQLPKYLQEATMACRTKIVFQTTPEDGRELAHLFPAPNEGVKPEHVDPHPCETLATHAHLYPDAVQEFIEWYVQPIALQAVGSHGNMIELHDLGVGVMDIALGMLNGGRIHSVKVENPTLYLDYLLQQAMVSADASLPIPALAVRGFANCGYSFWQLVKWLRDGDKRLTSDIPNLHIPPHLAAYTRDGWRWLRNPESGKESLLHFLFHLRLTMQYLAANPLGKQTVASASDVGKMLNQLPRRCAWVRSGTETGTIYTHDTPPANSRLKDDIASYIRDHSRAVYCHQKAEVEQQFNGEAQATPPPQPKNNIQNEPPKLSGWEEA
jgi:hypothetical protein